MYEKSGLHLVTIVAIVAITAIIIMVTGNTKNISEGAKSSSEDVVGQAAISKIAAIKSSDGSTETDKFMIIQGALSTIKQEDQILMNVPYESTTYQFRQTNPELISYNIIVIAQDGSGNFTNLNDAWPYIMPGTEVYIKNGNYYVISNSLPPISYDDVIIHGESVAGTIITQLDDGISGNNRLIRIGQAKNIIINNVSFITNISYNNGITSALMFWGEVGDETQGVRIENMFFSGYSLPIELNGPGYIREVFISNSRFLDNINPFGRTGYIGTTIEDIWFLNNYVGRIKTKYITFVQGATESIGGASWDSINRLNVIGNVFNNTVEDVSFNVLRVGIMETCLSCFDGVQTFSKNTFIVNNNDYMNLGVIFDDINSVMFINNTFSGSLNWAILVQSTTADSAATFMGNKYRNLAILNQDYMYSRMNAAYNTYLTVKDSAILNSTLYTWGGPPYNVVYNGNYYYDYVIRTPDPYVGKNIYNINNEYITIDTNPRTLKYPRIQ